MVVIFGSEQGRMPLIRESVGWYLSVLKKRDFRKSSDQCPGHTGRETRPGLVDSGWHTDPHPRPSLLLSKRTGQSSAGREEILVHGCRPRRQRSQRKYPKRHRLRVKPGEGDRFPLRRHLQTGEFPGRTDHILIGGVRAPHDIRPRHDTGGATESTIRRRDVPGCPPFGSTTSG